MSLIQFSKNDKEAMLVKIQHYFDKELGQELGRFDAEFLLEFFMQHIGVYFYNQGLFDAQTIIAQRTDELREAIFALEKPTEKLIEKSNEAAKNSRSKSEHDNYNTTSPSTRTRR